MGDPLYVTLDSMLRTNGEKKIIARRVEHDYLYRSFSELVEKVTHTEPDDYHQKEYSAFEVEAADYVYEMMQRANEDPGAVGLWAQRNKEPYDFISVGLSDNIEDYHDDIVSYEQITVDDVIHSLYRIDFEFSASRTGGVGKAYD